MTAKDWIDQFARRLGVEPPEEEEIGELLRLARTAAHSSERVAAPIACWLAARAGVAAAAAREAAEEID